MGAERIGPLQVDVFPLGEGSAILYSHVTGSSTLVSSGEGGLIGSARDSFKAPNEQVEYLRARACKFGVSEAAVATLVENLLAAGIFVSESSVLQHSQSSLIGQRNGKSAESDTVLAICTKNRPKELRRALVSYADNCLRHNRSAEFLIVDDSTDPEGRASLIGELGEAYPFAFGYTDRKQRQDLADRIAYATHVPQRTVRFALLGDENLPDCSVGAARNTALTLSRDRRLIMVDDDSVCRMFRVGQNSNSVRIGTWRYGEPAPYLHFFFANREEAVTRFPELDADFLEQHESILGHTLADFLPLRLEDNKFGPAFGGLVSRSRFVTPRVVASSCGFIGDSGANWSGHFLLTPPESLARLTAKPDLVDVYLTSREVGVAVRELLIWDGPLIGALNLGLDNRADLPPFFPKDRGEESIYTFQLRACNSGFLHGAQPLLLLHDPSEERNRPEWWNFGSPIGPPMVIQALVQIYSQVEMQMTSRTAVVEPFASTRRLGQFLVAWGSADHEEFSEYILTLLWRSWGSFISALQQQARSFKEQPAIGRLYEILERHLIDKFSTLALPAQSQDPNISQMWLASQKSCRDFGLVLQAWPEILDGARRAAIQ
jgi:glycosyltransferase involved in cell wall biosynthesis